MEAVKVKRISTPDLDNDKAMESLLRQAIRQGGYGYSYVVHTNGYAECAWALLADEPVNLGAVAIDIAVSYYEEGSPVSDCIAEDGKLVSFID